MYLGLTPVHDRSQGLLGNRSTGAKGPQGPGEAPRLYVILTLLGRNLGSGGENTLRTAQRTLGRGLAVCLAVSL